ncbi:MAG: hypothetical protein II038_02655, partial [Lachnospiraceae bacterium]|nr:hypothetical protein [Lachnospiraceae bacterium]
LWNSELAWGIRILVPLGEIVRILPRTTIYFASLLLKRPKFTLTVAYREKQPLCHLFAKPKGGKNLIFNIYHHLPEDSTAKKEFLLLKGGKKIRISLFATPSFAITTVKEL